MRQIEMLHKAVNEVAGEQTPADLWISGYDDLKKYLSDCSDEDDVWDLAERIAEDAQSSGCNLALDDIFEELDLRWRSNEAEKVPREAGSL